VRESGRHALRTEQLVAVVSHELRNPLTSIVMVAELLLDGDLDPDRVRRAAAVILRQAHQMAAVIELLDHHDAAADDDPVEVVEP
jgi:signal transduction histidine kinase